VEEESCRDYLSKLDIHKPATRLDASESGGGAEESYCKAVLFIISERSWEFGDFLEVWKKAKIKPIFKAKQEDLENYRQVSLISFPGKVIMQILTSVFEPQEGEREQQEWIYQGQIVSDPPDSLL